jgi:hypothetical protein
MEKSEEFEVPVEKSRKHDMRALMKRGRQGTHRRSA